MPATKPMTTGLCVVTTATNQATATVATGTATRPITEDLTGRTATDRATGTGARSPVTHQRNSRQVTGPAFPDLATHRSRMSRSTHTSPYSSTNHQRLTIGQLLNLTTSRRPATRHRISRPVMAMTPSQVTAMVDTPMPVMGNVQATVSIFNWQRLNFSKSKGA